MTKWQHEVTSLAKGNGSYVMAYILNTHSIAPITLMLYKYELPLYKETYLKDDFITCSANSPVLHLKI